MSLKLILPCFLRIEYFRNQNHTHMKLIVEIDSSYSVTLNANFVTVMTLLRSFFIMVNNETCIKSYRRTIELNIFA